ncbi:unnamed protein product [Arctia plantaginis]|uniref:Uncharacterized protein n=1 Tax=Arctia plantaginis TaxID=874455 RepID=A0A8S1BP43_ARCPL|nr:unnamed protein product [Arctia plantaginis]
MRMFLAAPLSAVRHVVVRGAGQYPRPPAPNASTLPKQISNYLKELQEYYSVHGKGAVGSFFVSFISCSWVWEVSTVSKSRDTRQPTIKGAGCPRTLRSSQKI